MSKYLQLREKLEIELTNVNQARENQITTLGDVLTSAKKNSISEPTFVESRSKARDIRKVLRDKRASVTRWQEIEKELQENRVATKEFEDKRVSLRSELELHWEDIGEAAFEMYRKSPGVFENSSEVLSDLQNLDSRIQEKEQEIRQLESDNAPGTLIGKTLRKGRGMVLKGSLRSREMQRGRQLRLIGEHLCCLDAAPAVPENSPLSQLMAPLRGSIDTLRGSERALKELGERKTAIEKERVAIEKGARMRNPVRNLEHQISQGESELQSLYNRIGHLFDEFGTDTDRTDGRVGKIFATIDSMDGKIKKLEQLLRRTNAALELEQLEKQAATLDSERRSLQKQMDKLDTDRERIDQEIGKKSKIRGNPATLVLAEETD